MSFRDFENYHISEEIIKSLELMGFKEPTEVQGKVLQSAKSGGDIIVQSQTGSGKTAAFGIPLCESIDIEECDPQALVLTPTRELCIQVKEDINNIGRFKRIRCAAVFGKQPINIQLRELKQRVHIVIGTPGRVSDHITRGTLKLDKIKYLIIDEADKMLNMGFIEQVEEIIKMVPRDRITMLFSATIPEEIENLCSKYMHEPSKISITSKNLVPSELIQELYEAESEDKLNLLYNLLYIENPDSCIIFCDTKESVDKLYNEMRKKGFKCNRLHGGMYQEDRLETMKKFKRGEFRLLVATDVASRGIDIENLDLTINYEVPMEKESYVHRIGRTGRAGKSGKAITLAAPYENKFLNQIEEYIGYNIPVKNPPSNTEISIAKKEFISKNNSRAELKADKGSLINSQVTKIYINAGSKKKIRPGDIVGAISSIEGVSAEDIGIIDVQEGHSYIDILNKKGELVLEALQDTSIKGKKVKAQRALK